MSATATYPSTPFGRAAAELVRSVTTGKRLKALNRLKIDDAVYVIKHAEWYEGVDRLSLTVEHVGGKTFVAHADSFGLWNGPPVHRKAERWLLASGRYTSAHAIRAGLKSCIRKMEHGERWSTSTQDQQPKPKQAARTVDVPSGVFSAEIVELADVRDDDIVLSVTSVTSGAALKKLDSNRGKIVVRVVGGLQNQQEEQA